MTTDRHPFGSPFLKFLLILPAIGVLVFLLNRTAASDRNSGKSEVQTESQPSSQTSEQLRRQARILHTTVHSTLRVVHDRYYREDEGLLIPAHVLKETFRDIESAEGIQLRWLAVEGQPMNTDHVARDDFEKAAVTAIKSGEPFYELVTDTLYRRAAPVTLTNHCLKCHMPDRKSTEDRRAGLIVTIPLQ